MLGAGRHDKAKPPHDSARKSSKGNVHVPWRLVLILLILTIVVIFAAFNTKNASDISFGFVTLRAVPVFLSLLIAFLVGAFVVLPFSIGRKNPATADRSRTTGVKDQATQAKDVNAPNDL